MREREQRVGGVEGHKAANEPASSLMPLMSITLTCDLVFLHSPFFLCCFRFSHDTVLSSFFYSCALVRFFLFHGCC